MEKSKTNYLPHILLFLKKYNNNGVDEFTAQKKQDQPKKNRSQRWTILFSAYENLLIQYHHNFLDLKVTGDKWYF